MGCYRYARCPHVTNHQNKKRMKFIKAIYTLIVLMLVTSCVSDFEGDNTTDQSNGIPMPITLKITTRSMNTTEAPEGFYTDDINEIGTDNELINSYFVVFVHDAGSQKGRIASIISRDPSHHDAVQFEEIETKIPEGYYVIYAFANISKTAVETAIGTTLTEGITMPDISNTVWPFNTTRNADTLVPMSNKQTVNFTSHANPSFAIEVVRMVGKVQFYFRNQTSYPLTIVDYNIQPLSNACYLLGRTDSGKPIIPGSANKNVSFTGSLTDSEALMVQDDEEYHTTSAFCIYTAESHVTKKVHTTEHYVMTFNLKHHIPGGEVTESQRFSLTPNQFSYILRNQYIIQPITFTDWVLEPEARFYPPIGGYPTVKMESVDSYHECYARFNSPNEGVFVIHPRLRNMINPDYWVYMTDTRYIKDYSIDVTDFDGIFSEQPAFHAGEIIGKFNGNKGRAKITFNVTIQVSETLQRLYQRDLYIENADF